VSLVPGLYDIYAQPVASTNCQIAPKLWRGVEVDRDSEVVAWAPPATLDLPSPLKLGGRIQRTGGTLADWQLEIIDPQDGKVISTSARLGATTDTAPLTNFEVNYQPLEYTATASNRAHQPGALGLLIRLKPPKDGESTVPTVYADLEAAAAGTGQVNLDVSKLPPATSLVTVTGQVRGADNNGVRSTVTFVNSTFQIQGLPAAFGPAAATDETGRYTTRLFPGSYRVIIVPEGADDNIPASAKPARPWALTERQQTIGTEPTQVVDMTVARTRVIEGFATAGIADGPAQGATLEASPLDTTPLGVLGKVFTPPVSPSKASVAVDDSNGHFSLILDPGYYDFVLKPATTSNFAWWIFPSVRVLTAEQPGQVGTFDPQLLYPVPLKGIITVTMPDKTAQPLRNAIVQAYARTPAGNVTQVGTARTDDMGRYYVALPPSFYSP
jgi:hypothetical protein